jgi:hypothetical protein
MRDFNNGRLGDKFQPATVAYVTNCFATYRGVTPASSNNAHTFTGHATVANNNVPTMEATSGINMRNEMLAWTSADGNGNTITITDNVQVDFKMEYGTQTRGAVKYYYQIKQGNSGTTNGNYGYFDIHKRITVEQCPTHQFTAGTVFEDVSETDTQNDQISDFGPRAFRLTLDTSACKLCGVRASHTTADIFPDTPGEVLEQLALLPNILKDSVTNVKNIQVTHTVTAEVAGKGKVIKWRITFTGDNVMGDIPEITINQQITTGSALLTTSITDTIDVADQPTISTPTTGQSGAFRLSYDGLNTNCMPFYQSQSTGTVGDMTVLAQLELLAGKNLKVNTVTRNVLAINNVQPQQYGMQFMVVLRKLNSQNQNYKPKKIIMDSTHCRDNEGLYVAFNAGGPNDGDGNAGLTLESIASVHSNVGAVFKLRFDTSGMDSTTICNLCDLKSGTEANTLSMDVVPFSSNTLNITGSLGALATIGGTNQISVSRQATTEFDDEERYVYNVTFVGAKVEGNVPQLKYVNTLTGDYPTITINTPVPGNEIEPVSTFVLGLDDNKNVPAGISDAAGKVYTKFGNTFSQPINSSAPSMSSDTIYSGLSLESKLSAMQNIGAVKVERTQLKNKAGGYIWTITFLSNDGDIDLLSCNKTMVHPTKRVSGDSTGNGIHCTPKTVVNGSFIGGTFVVTYPYVDTASHDDTVTNYNTAALPWNVDEGTLKTEIQNWNVINKVSVSRERYETSPSWGGAYTWHITFETAPGDVPKLFISTTSLTGTNAGSLPNITTGDGDKPVSGSERKGNTVEGSFRLEFQGTLSANISSRVNETQMKKLLEDMSTIDEVSVTRSAPDAARGYEWTVTFIHPKQGGNVPQFFVPNTCGTYSNESCSYLLGTQVSVGITTKVQGGHLQGSFRLKYMGYHTGLLAHDISPNDLAVQLMTLPNIGNVTVSREMAPDQPGKPTNVKGYGSTAGPSQVQGYTWAVTYNSHIHDGTDHGRSEWATGTYGPAASPLYSTAWGRNVGNLPNLVCDKTNLRTATTAHLNTSGTETCTVNDATYTNKFEDGSEPLKGTFQIVLDTTNCATCEVKTKAISNKIHHNAKATRADSNGDSTSMEEVLELLSNVGDVDVSRGPVNITTGGYEWRITFQRDAQSSLCIPSDGTESTGCHSPGNVPDLVTNATSLGGTTRTITTVEINRGNVLRGEYNVSLKGTSKGPNTYYYNGTTPKVPWNAKSTEVKKAIEVLTGCTTVEVTRYRLGKYGAHTWNVTFTENPNQHPPGTGDMKELEIEMAYMTESAQGNCPACLFDSYTTSRSSNVTVEELQKGSEGLSGGFRVNFRTASNGPKDFTFNHGASEMESLLEQLYSINDIHVTKETHGAGWYHIPVDPRVEPQPGGYKWRITFVTNHGLYNQTTFPPGSGDLPSFQTWHTDPINKLNGNQALISVNETQKGTTELGGYFSLTYENATSSAIPYDSTAVDMKTSLEALPTIGNASVTRHWKTMQALPGVVSVQAGQGTITISSIADWTSLLSFGDVIRIGGGTGNATDGTHAGVPGTSGDILIGSAKVTKGSSTVEMKSDSRRQIYVGQQIRINGHTYTVNGTNAAHLQLKIKSNQTMTAGAFQLEINGNTSSQCIGWNDYPSKVAEFFETFKEFDKTTVFTALEDNGKTRVFNVYLNGPKDKTISGLNYFASPIDIKLKNFGSTPCSAGAPTNYQAIIEVIVKNDGSNFTSALNTIEIDTPYKSPSRTNAAVLKVAETFAIYKHEAFTSSGLTLATLDSLGEAKAVWKGISSTSSGLKAYKVNGFDWVTRFDTNIGDLPPMVSNVTDLGGSDKQVAITDDLFEGILPSAYDIPNLKTGIPYYSRVKVSNPLGYSTHSNVAIHTPSQRPDSPRSINVGYAAHVDEIQTITTAATHVDEIQTIQTTAVSVDEVQTVTTSARSGKQLSGHFAISFNGWSTKYEIQDIVISSTNSSLVSGGGFKVGITGNAARTPCMNATDVSTTDLGTAIGSLTGINTVIVHKSVVAVNNNKGSTITFRVGFEDKVNHAALVVEKDACDAFIGGVNHTLEVKQIDDGGIDIPFDATQEAVQAQLALLPSVGKTFVVRSLADEESGYRWSLSMTDLNGNVGSFACEGDDTFNTPDTGALCQVDTIVDGNELGGSFTLTYQTETTAAIAHNAPTNDVVTAVEALSNIRNVAVTRSGPDSEGGYIWTVTFTNDIGDLVKFGSVNSLTGTGSLITIKETQRGNIIDGTFTLSYKTQTTHPIKYNAPATGTDSVKEELMKLTNVNYLDVTRNIADEQRGYTWTITFRDDTMQGDLPLITANVDKLSGVGVNILVTEERKGSEATGNDLHLSFGVPLFDGGVPINRYRVEWDTTSGFNSGNLKFQDIMLDTFLYEVNYVVLKAGADDLGGTFQLIYDGSLSENIPAVHADKSRSEDLVRNALEKLPSVKAVRVNRGWKIDNGYTYSVTFQSLKQTAPKQTLRFNEHKLTGTNATLSIQGQDCHSCHYIKGLTMGAAYYSRISSCNIRGCSDPTILNHSVVPKQLPSSPTAVRIEVVSGSELEVFFGPPGSTGGAAVTSYIIEWDIVDSFNSLGVGKALGQATIQGGAIAGSPPFSYLIGSNAKLNDTSTYFVRVAASNDVPAQQVSPILQPPDNRNWETSTPAALRPKNLAPNPPDSVKLSLISKDTLRIIIRKPSRMGGVTVDKYKIEYDMDMSFTSVKKGNRVVAVSSMRQLDSSGALIYDITNLLQGEVHYVRVMAHNGVGSSDGYGLPRLATPSYSIPRRSPEPPQNIVIATSSLQATPIRHIDVTWSVPTDSGGNAITNYKIEWWSKLHEYEVQSILLQNTHQADTNGSFIIKYDNEKTTMIPHDVDAERLRHELMIIKDNQGNSLIGPVEVTRSIYGYGYKWMITFVDQTKNIGDVRPLVVDRTNLVSLGGSGTISLTVTEEHSGVRSQGFSEIQEVNLNAQCTSGYYRLAFASSGWSSYIPFDATLETVELALETLPTVGDVTVSKMNAQNVWHVTFKTNIGNLPQLQMESSKLVGLGCVGKTYDGDNEVTNNGVKVCEKCFPGETANQYHVVTVPSITRSYQIQKLITGTTYIVQMSAINDRGSGRVALATPNELFIPMQVPGAPTAITVYTKPRSSSELYVNYSAPLSDGGAPMQGYKIEWDTSPTFGSVGKKEIRCPSYDVKEVQELRIAVPPGDNSTIQQATNNDQLNTFRLQLTYGGKTYTSAYIRPSEMPMASDEPFVQGGNSYIGSCSCPACTEGYPRCTGSLQSHLQRMPNIGHVKITRTVYGTKGDLAWRITFMTDLGDIPALKVVNNNVRTMYNPALITVTTIGDGAVFPACTGQQLITGLVQGSMYFIRITAFNQIGYGAGGYSKPSAQKPMVVPGVPTGVTLQVVDGTSMRVFINPPQDDGGDTVTKYMVEWDIFSNFTSGLNNSALGQHEVTNLAGGAPFIYTIPSLTTGVDYYVRVSAYNQMGYGLPTPTSPPYEHPRRIPTAPTSVKLGITSNSKLTVSFDLPTDIGGDPISHFKIEWDRISNFQSRHSLPHKGEVEVDATKHRSYTISPEVGLQENIVYYVRVSAKNLVGYGATQWPEPAFAMPNLQVPGRITTAKVAPQTGVEGNLTVFWSYPRVPAHSIFCGGGGPGNLTLPDNCPTGMGRGTEADGGTPILSYKVEWDTNKWFNSTNSLPEKGFYELTNLAGGEPYQYTIPSLTKTKTYYVRLFAYNARGDSAACDKTGVLCDGVRLSGVPDGIP